MGLNLNYKMTPHMQFTIDGSIERNRYPRETTSGGLTKKRRDYIFDSGARLKWKPIRYLTFAVGYGLRERASNFDNTFDYIVHSFDASASYELS